MVLADINMPDAQPSIHTHKWQLAGYPPRKHTRLMTGCRAFLHRLNARETAAPNRDRIDLR